MKILYVTPVFSPYRAGMARVAQMYADAAHHAGHDVSVVTPRYYDRDVASFEYEVRWIRPIVSFGNAAWIRDVSRAVLDVDIIHIHVPFIGGVHATALLVRKYPDARVVVTYHMNLVSNGWKRPFFWLWRLLSLPVIARMADVLHVTSLDYFKHSQLAQYVTDMSVVHEIPLAVDVSAAVVRKNVDGLSMNLLIVAALDAAHAFKGVYRALEAFVSIIRVIPGARMTIVGDGDMRGDYELRVQELGLSASVVFAGRLSDQSLLHAYAKADLTLLPSTAASEAFGLVLIESQAAGTPVVASNLPGVRTTFVEGKTGFCVDVEGVQSIFDVCMKWFELDESEKLRMRIACHEHAQQFDQVLVCDRVLDLYESS